MSLTRRLHPHGDLNHEPMSSSLTTDRPLLIGYIRLWAAATALRAYHQRCVFQTYHRKDGSRSVDGVESRGDERASSVYGFTVKLCRCAAPSGIDHHPNTHTLITVATKHRARTHTSWAGLHRRFARTCTRFIVMSLGLCEQARQVPASQGEGRAPLPSLRRQLEGLIRCGAPPPPPPRGTSTRRLLRRREARR